MISQTEIESIARTLNEHPVASEDIVEVVALVRANLREHYARLVEDLGAKGYGTLAIAAMIRRDGEQ